MSGTEEGLKPDVAEGEISVEAEEKKQELRDDIRNYVVGVQGQRHAKMLKMFIKAVKKIDLYPYQVKAAEVIFDSLANKLGGEVFNSWSRQSGKTEVMADIVYYLVTTKAFGEIRVGIFAPKMEQAGIMFERIKTNYQQGSALYSDVGWTVSNANNFRLTNGCFIKTITASDKSSIEGETFNLIIADETESISDTKLLKSIFPMGAATNATRVLIGTPSMSFTNEYGRDCRYFYEGITRYRGTPFSYEVPYEIAAESNANYAKFIENEKINVGEESDEFRTQYKLEWMLEALHFITFDKLKLLGTYTLKRRPYWSETPCFGGIDLAKSPESTVVTIGTILKRGYEKQAKNKICVLNWLELKGEDYETQAVRIGDFLDRYKMTNIAIDTTGVGSPVIEIFRRVLPAQSFIEIKWTTESHNDLYKKLQLYMERQRLEFPYDKTRECKEFVKQFLNLQKGYRGSYMVCHHPERRGAMDDYCSSLAMMVWIMDAGLTDARAAPKMKVYKLLEEMGLASTSNPYGMNEKMGAEARRAFGY